MISEFLDTLVLSRTVLALWNFHLTWTREIPFLIFNQFYTLDFCPWFCWGGEGGKNDFTKKKKKMKKVIWHIYHPISLLQLGRLRPREGQWPVQVDSSVGYKAQTRSQVLRLPAQCAFSSLMGGGWNQEWNKQLITVLISEKNFMICSASFQSWPGP